VKFSFALVKCGRCGKSYSNPLTHVCVSRARRRGRTRIAPKASVSVKCGTCGKPYANPLTHVCSVKGSFRRRAAASRRGQRKAARPPKAPRVKVYGQPAPAKAAAHPYAACRDDDCDRRPCVAYKDGFADGQATAS
jgi:hypothetical protein